MSSWMKRRTGHRGVCFKLRRLSKTKGFVHLADVNTVETAEKVGRLIAEAMNVAVSG